MSSRRHLPIVESPASSLANDGRRNAVEPADVAGRFTTRKYVVYAFLIVLYVALPFIQIEGRPAVFLDVLHRRFYLFGASFNATDFWLVFFLMSGVGFVLIMLTTLFGRVWCGYACPQTVFLEGVFRRIERLLEGPRAERLRRNAGPLTLDKVVRKLIKHAVFATLCIALGHVFLSYFVSLPSMWSMVQRSPTEHLEAFGWVAAFSLVTYLDFAWFREQLCLIICPYGRLQSALTDADTIVIGYDALRGEPRGKTSVEAAGDCIDCRRCVVVCPTGIDIRNGLQLDCIGCSACVDACDDVMDKIARPRGLVRYDSERGFGGGRKRFLRPRIALYAALGVIGLAVASIAVASRTPFEAHLLRTGGAGFVVDDASRETVNPVRLQLVNKSGETMVLTTRSVSGADVSVTPETATVTLRPGASRYVSMLVRVPLDALDEAPTTRIEVAAIGYPDDVATVSLPVVGPRER